MLHIYGHEKNKKSNVSNFLSIHMPLNFQSDLFLQNVPFIQNILNDNLQKRQTKKFGSFNFLIILFKCC